MYYFSIDKKRERNLDSSGNQMSGINLGKYPGTGTFWFNRFSFGTGFKKKLNRFYYRSDYLKKKNSKND